VHGQDEQTGKNHLMLEGTDGRVHFIQYTREMEEARSQGLMKINSFVRLRRTVSGFIGVEDLGDAEKLLHNSRHFAEAARRFVGDERAPTDDGWGGWLGRFQTTLCRAFLEMDEWNRHDRVPIPKRRDRSPDLGR
jgi:hypothetical protein